LHAVSNEDGKKAAPYNLSPKSLHSSVRAVSDNLFLHFLLPDSNMAPIVLICALPPHPKIHYQSPLVYCVSLVYSPCLSFFQFLSPSLSCPTKSERGMSFILRHSPAQTFPFTSCQAAKLQFGLDVIMTDKFGVAVPISVACMRACVCQCDRLRSRSI